MNRVQQRENLTSTRLLEFLNLFFKWIFYRGAFLKSERRLISKVAAVLMKTCRTSTSGFIFVREQVVYICSFEIFKWCKIEGSQRSLNMLLVRGTHHHLNNPLLHTHRWRLVLKETAWRQGGWSFCKSLISWKVNSQTILIPKKGRGDYKKRTGVSFPVVPV